MASNQNPISAIDMLTSALRSNIIPNQEYLLQGSVIDSSAEVLHNRLRGLCDAAETGPETFHDHEMCFSLKASSPGGTPQQQQSFLLRVRRALDHPEYPWQLRYLGQPELGEKNQPTVLRSCIDIACTPNVVEFLSELGCRIEFEYVLKGYLFRKGRMKVTMSKIFRMGQAKSPDSLEAMTGSYLVELSLLAPSGQDAVADEIKVFAEQLRPLVHLEKIGYRRLQSYS
uniref:Mediator of RNA polymerase II transcription subunit 18 n=1 Tax=Daphnia similis TaxID=35528 RepID=A0A4Y7N5Z4_9CRUS|nr:EOG090X0CKJ [Daphnia similis]